MEPKLSLNEAQEVVETTKHPRVTLEGMKAKIADVTYHYHAHLTVCIVTMDNGFFVVGTSAPADVRNYDRKVGERYAFEDCIRQLWRLEGYALVLRTHEGW